MTALDDLIRAVEAGKWDSRFDQPSDETGLSEWALTFDAIMGSGDLNAAKRLHDVLLPGWFVVITRLCEDFDSATEKLMPKDWRADLSDGTLGWNGCDDPEVGLSSADNADPARAWLLSILRALQAQATAPGANGGGV